MALTCTLIGYAWAFRYTDLGVHDTDSRFTYKVFLTMSLIPYVVQRCTCTGTYHSVS